MKKTLLFIICLSGFVNGYSQLPTYVPTGGLVAWYPFSGNADDISGNMLNGTVTGPVSTTDRFMNAGSAYSFSNSYIYIPSNVLFNTSTGLSVSAWVNLSTPNLDQKVIGRTNTSFNSGFVFGVDSSKVYPEVWDNAGTHYTFRAGTVSSGGWDHIVMTWNSGGYFVVYVNGAAADSILASALPIGTNSEPMIVGVSPWSISPTYLAVFGDIDDIGIWNRALTANEVLGLYWSIQGTHEADSFTPAVFPSPANDQLTVELPAGTYKTEMTDALGRVVYSSESNKARQSVDCAGLPGGLYVVRVTGNSGTGSRKVLIRHD